MGVSIKNLTLNRHNSSYIGKIFSMKVLALLVLSLAAFATAAPGRCGRSPGWCGKNRHKSTALKSIAATAASTPSLSTLLAAVKAAGLAETLSGEGTFTVFAPNNAAFDKLPKGTVATLLKPENLATLKSILLRHVLPVKIKAGQIPRGKTSVKTVGGEEIEITKTGRKVSIKSSAGTANVIATDVLASNGVVHVVDSVF